MVALSPSVGGRTPHDGRGALLLMIACLRALALVSCCLLASSCVRPEPFQRIYHGDFDR
jgi:hypothetical protein